ncbi:prevent-host-death family protein [Actinomyces sp. Chiba101]|uniref:Antitoxin n=1 Tax=Actinomyces denticolens TaxID=52767 RepID=A0ABY1HYB0_9ACTO|nr:MULTISPECIES: type II toxin-antitoxin system Phd/YefM family antitoxin [Actinomyces]BAW93711.1 prevent-host-death family protein [Actinomyces sp. Chiba101]GAV93432.1 hypothetical protein ADENT20671_0175 [Actinomyces denticolens]SHI30782.1 prevent-host-death family protein [Actinomyces denticolens]SUU74666.1 prevent-host-death family protein [Actinomyces denticolens]
MQTTITARALNQDVSAAKRAAAHGPVVITDRGRPSFVLMSIDDYRALRPKRSLAEALRMDDGSEDGEDIDIEFSPVNPGALPRAADL